MLTLIAYRFLLSNDLPKLSYLTRLDYFLLGSTVMVFTALVAVAASTRLEDTGQSGPASTLNRHSRWFFPLLFVVLLLVSGWI